MINLSAIKVTWRKPYDSFKIVTEQLFPFPFVLYSKIRAFLNSFESKTLRLSAVRLWGSSFHKVYPSVFRRQVAMTLYQIHRYLSSFVGDSENTEDHQVLPPLRSEKLLQYSFWHFGDIRPIVRPRFRTHFADILNSQLMYTGQLLMIKGGLTLILSFPKACFISRIRRSNFRCFLHCAF